MPDMLTGASAVDRLELALEIIEALQDGMFSPDHTRGDEPLTFYPKGRAGMGAVLDCIRDHIKAAQGMLQATNDPISTPTPFHP